MSSSVRLRDLRFLSGLVALVLTLAWLSVPPLRATTSALLKIAAIYLTWTRG